MKEERKNFNNVWVSPIISVSYCYFLSTRIKAGVFRLHSVLPVCAMFFVLPLFISSSTFCLYTAFFFYPLQISNSFSSPSIKALFSHFPQISPNSFPSLAYPSNINKTLKPYLIFPQMVFHH